MKKFLLALCLCSLLLIAFVPTLAVAQTPTADDSYKQSQEYLFVQDFCARFPNRASDRDQAGNKEAAYYLKDLFNQVLTSVPNQATEVTRVSGIKLDDGSLIHNVSAYLNTDKYDKQIVIGAHYDSTGEGASDNACGVAALYFAMKGLAVRAETLPFGITFVAFDGEERGLLGSKEYVNNLTQQQKDSILVMFNIDTIANGDKLYVYCETKHTDLQQLVVDNTKNITHKPYAKGTLFGLDNWGYGYFDMVQSTDQTPFRLEGIPTALFFSGNYDTSLWGYLESTDSRRQTMNSATDTFANLDANVGAQFVERIQTVSAGIVSTVASQQFVGVAGNARSQLVDVNWVYKTLVPTVVVAVVTVLLAVGAWLYYRKIKKQSQFETAEIKNNSIFGSPDAEDIFTFKK